MDIFIIEDDNALSREVSFLFVSTNKTHHNKVNLCPLKLVLDYIPKPH